MTEPPKTQKIAALERVITDPSHPPRTGRVIPRPVAHESPMTLTVREATPDEVAAVLTHTRPLWGESLDLDTYVARTRILLTTPWGRDHYRFMVGLAPDGTIATACKRYHLAMHMHGRPAPAVGFGAVFTPEAHRGQGHAATLLRTIMAAERVKGIRLALLFTDIGPAYYERLGFHAIRCEVGEAPAEAGPIAFVPVGDEDPAPLMAWHRSPDVGLGFGRSADYWAFTLARHRPALHLYAPAGVPLGYAALHIEPETVWVDEAGFAPEVDPTAFWQALRAFAAHHGAPTVRGWLPHEATAAGYTFTPLTTNAPMAAPLQGDVIPTAAQLWANDHF